MRVDHVSIDPSSCVSLQRYSTIWEIFEKGCLINYLVKLKGHDLDLSFDFAMAWENGMVIVMGVIMHFTKDFISKVFDMVTAGLESFKDRTRRLEELDPFLMWRRKFILWRMV